MDFEYDDQKSLSNQQKHGIGFDEAKAIWDDPGHAEIPAKVTDESRSLVIGVIRGKHWSAVITRRNGKIRLISVRRARKEEIEIYESV